MICGRRWTGCFSYNQRWNHRDERACHNFFYSPFEIFIFPECHCYFTIYIYTYTPSITPHPPPFAEGWCIILSFRIRGAGAAGRVFLHFHTNIRITSPLPLCVHYLKVLRHCVPWKSGGRAFLGKWTESFIRKEVVQCTCMHSCVTQSQFQKYSPVTIRI